LRECHLFLYPSSSKAEKIIFLFSHRESESSERCNIEQLVAGMIGESSFFEGKIQTTTGGNSRNSLGQKIHVELWTSFLFLLFSSTVIRFNENCFYCFFFSGGKKDFTFVNG
jgi:hypothetical protein